MRYLLTADVHAHVYPKLSQPDSEYGTTGLRSIIQVLKQMKQHVDINKIDKFVVIGDLFHTRGIVNTFVYSAVFDVLYEISKKTEVVLLAGNHDQATKAFTPTALRVFKSFATVIEEPTYYDGDLYLPYSEDLDLLRSIIAKTNAKYCFAHLGINGAKIMGYEYVSDKNLDVTDFAKFEFTFLGHYHMSQYVAKNVVYVGSPLQHSFNDAGMPKVFVDFDTTNLDSLNVIETTAKRFFIFEIHKLQEFNRFKSEYEEGNFYWLKNFTKNTLDVTGMPNVRVTQELTKEAPEPRIKNIESISDEELIKQYLNNFDSVVKGQNFQEYLKAGVSLLKGVEYD